MKLPNNFCFLWQFVFAFCGNLLLLFALNILFEHKKRTSYHYEVPLVSKRGIYLPKMELILSATAEVS